MVSPLRGIKQTQFGGAEWGMYGSESMKNRGASLPPRPTAAAAVAVVVDEISGSLAASPGYRFSNLPRRVPSRVCARVCTRRWAPCGIHCICCFLHKRLLIRTLTVDSTNEVEITSPLRQHSP